jgi:hypothetical protein
MKKYLILSILLLPLAWGCNDKAFLDKQPTNILVDNQIWGDKSLVLSVVADLYDRIPQYQTIQNWADFTSFDEGFASAGGDYWRHKNQGDKLTGYLSQNGISSDEANNSLEVTRLIKSGDFTNALKILDPIVQDLRKRTGEVLEPDLQEDVRLGNVPHDRALELQRLRASDAAARERGQRQEAQSREQQQREASSQFVNSIAKAADDWAKARAGSDPDWDKKQTEVAEIVELDLRRNGFPKSTEEAVQRSEKALAQVNDRWKKLRGPPAEIKPAVGGGRTSTRANDPPKTALEAVNRALGG